MNLRSLKAFSYLISLLCCVNILAVVLDSSQDAKEDEFFAWNADGGSSFADTSFNSHSNNDWISTGVNVLREDFEFAWKHGDVSELFLLPSDKLSLIFCESREK